MVGKRTSQQNGNFTRWRKLQFLQHYPEKFPWDAKALFCHIHYWKLIPSSVYHLNRIPGSRILTVYVSLELRRCNCTEMRDSRRKLPKYSNYSSKNLVALIPQTLEVFVWKILQRWRILFKQMFFVGYWHCRRIFDCGVYEEDCRETP